MRRISRSAAAALCVLLCPLAAWSQTLTPLYTIEGHIDGAGANGPLVQVGGKLYGTTSSGAAHGCGEVFGEDPATGRKSTVYAFTCQGDGGAPGTGLTVVGGQLFGTTSANGANGNGTVFEVDRTAGTERTLYSFTVTEGRNSAPLLSYNGLLYGTLIEDGRARRGLGTIYTVNPLTGVEATIHAFTGTQNDGAYPYGLTRMRDMIYGVTFYGGSLNDGAIYQLNPASGVVTTLYSFTELSRGLFPSAPMIERGGVLYGTTFSGGRDIFGSVFSFRPHSGKLRFIHRFKGHADGRYLNASLVSDRNLLFGVTESPEVLFSIDPSTGQETTLHTFSSDEGYGGGGLIDVGGTLYGTQQTSGFVGQSGGGTLFGYGIASGEFTILHRFTGDSTFSPSRLLKVGRTLYGTTPDGGTMGLGSIFKVDIDGSGGKTLYSFTGNEDGAEPKARLIEVDGKLYGTTYTGAPHLFGSVFSYDLASHALSTIHAFADGTDGRNPEASLIEVGGALYGTTALGGTAESGVVYKIDLTTQAETVLHDFKTRAGGQYPIAGLTEAGGLLYGTTSGGGLGCGTIYSLDPVTGSETLLYSFRSEIDGCIPVSDLVFDGSMLFGSTDGFSSGYNSAFSYDPATQAFKVLQLFKKASESPNAPFALVGRGLYSTTPSFVNSSGSTTSFGSIIDVDSRSGHVTTLYEFTGGADGFNPSGLIHADDAFFGTAAPPSDMLGLGGVVFKFEP